MTFTGFKLLESDLNKARDKAGLIPLSKYLRTLLLMWINGEIEVSDQDIKQHHAQTQ